MPIGRKRIPVCLHRIISYIEACEISTNIKSGCHALQKAKSRNKFFRCH